MAAARGAHLRPAAGGRRPVAAIRDAAPGPPRRGTAPPHAAGGPGLELRPARAGRTAPVLRHSACSTAVSRSNWRWRWPAQAPSRAGRWSTAWACWWTASLVTVSHEDPPRYGLLETMRHYALERLAAAGDEGATRRRHAAAMEALFDDAQHLMRGADQNASWMRASAEMANAREALAWAMRHDRGLAVRLSAQVCYAATLTAWRSDAFAWQEACEAFVDEVAEPRSRARWWRHYAMQSIVLRAPAGVRACAAGGRSRARRGRGTRTRLRPGLPGPRGGAVGLTDGRRPARGAGAHPAPPGVAVRAPAAAAQRAGPDLPHARRSPTTRCPSWTRPWRSRGARGSRVGVDATLLNLAQALRRCGRGDEALKLLQTVESGNGAVLVIHSRALALAHPVRPGALRRGPSRARPPFAWPMRGATRCGRPWRCCRWAWHRPAGPAWRRACWDSRAACSHAAASIPPAPRRRTWTPPRPCCDGSWPDRPSTRCSPRAQVWAKTRFSACWHRPRRGDA